MVDRVGASGPFTELDPSRAVWPVWGRQASTEAGGRGDGRDEVSISAEAVRMQRAREAVERAPAVRRAVVDQFREAIADDAYKVDSRAVAESILDVLA